MRLPGVSNDLAIPMPEQSGTESSLAASQNFPRLREVHAFGVKSLRRAEIGAGAFAASTKRKRTESADKSGALQTLRGVRRGSAIAKRL
jgi:hypothetical protein